MIFLAADLSNAENRVCLMLTRDAAMLRLARSKPWEIDLHAENVRAIFGKTPADVPLDEWKTLRQLGKVVSHGAQRGMRGPTLSDNIMKELGLFVPPGECDRHIDAFLRTYAPVKDYFRDTRLRVVKQRALANTWGRILRFDHDELTDDAVFREALSFPLSSEVADLLNQWGLIPLYHEMMRRYGRPPNTQTHDSLLASVPAADAWDIMQFIRSTLERPRVYYGEALTIPVCFSLGSTWNMAKEFIRPPARAEFEEAAYACEEESAKRVADEGPVPRKV